MDFYGSINLTRLGEIVRKHPEAVKTVNFKDGTTAKFLDVNFNEKKEADKYGNTNYLKAGIKKAEQKEDVNYYIGDFKPSTYNQQELPASMQQSNSPANSGTAASAPVQSQDDANDLPF